ncbi:MAG TPA: exodeoxyribonuclease III [Alphaproteobacteria bacterium]|nr:exodeoxyribonuclease III [Alphaproteobacteria bacterium]
MRIACWNVNSIRSRLEILLKWIDDTAPDVILLQEIKCEEGAFPFEILQDKGYLCAVHGQKSYNGVAILSKYTLEDVTKGLPTLNGIDVQARYIEAVVAGRFRVASVYVPNGQSIGSEKFFYKLLFLEKLQEHLRTLLTHNEICIIGGDYNIAPSDDDIANPVKWQDEIMCSQQERSWYKSFLNLGYIDCLKECTKSWPLYTWWDYRSGSWPKDQGLRIDHFLATSLAYENVTHVGVDKAIRGLERTSDHAPIWLELKE